LTAAAAASTVTIAICKRRCAVKILKVSILALGVAALASPAFAFGECGGGHSKTAQTEQTVATADGPQTVVVKTQTAQQEK